MKSEWKEVKLEDITSILGDGLHGTPKYSENGEYFFINGNNLDNGKISVNKQTKKVGYNEYIKIKKDLNDRTILISINGTLGNVALYNGEKVCLGKSACYFNVVDNVDKQFVRYIMTSDIFKHYLDVNATGTTIKNMGLKAMRQFSFLLPPLPTQKKMAHILSTLDDKIELNRKMNQTLESMASAIFKSWFVDFDPVHAKANCEDEAELENIAKELGISKAILDLFPNEFIESELGMIPKGWEVKTIKDFGRVVTGKTPPSKIEDAYNDDGKPFITPTDIDDSLFLVTTNRHLSTNGEISIKNTIISAGSICVTCIGSQMGKTIISPYDACINQQINSIIVNSNNLRNYLFCNLRNRKNEIFLMGSGGSTMPLLNKSTFEKMKVLLPQKDILNKFDILVKDKLLLVLKNDLENITLSKIRNNLLPKLISGDIEV